MLLALSYGEWRGKLKVERGMQLRSIQQELCRLFGQPFPSMKARLDINGVIYDEFGDTPFSGRREDEAARA